MTTLKAPIARPLRRKPSLNERRRRTGREQGAPDAVRRRRDLEVERLLRSPASATVGCDAVSGVEDGLLSGFFAVRPALQGDGSAAFGHVSLPFIDGD